MWFEFTHCLNEHRTFLGKLHGQMETTATVVRKKDQMEGYASVIMPGVMVVNLSNVLPRNIRRCPEFDSWLKVGGIPM